MSSLSVCLRMRNKTFFIYIYIFFVSLVLCAAAARRDGDSIIAADLALDPGRCDPLFRESKLIGAFHQPPGGGGGGGSSSSSPRPAPQPQTVPSPSPPPHTTASTTSNALLIESSKRPCNYYTQQSSRRSEAVLRISLEEEDIEE